jgi:ABC-2 type transport system ATP-binding protein
VRGVEDPARITELLARAGIYVRELTPLRADLEQVFLDLTTGEGPGQAPPGGRHAGRDGRTPPPLQAGEPVPAAVEGGEPR